MKEEGGSHYTYRHIRRYSYFRKLPFAILWAVIVVNQVQQMSSIAKKCLWMTEKLVERNETRVIEAASVLDDMDRKCYD